MLCDDNDILPASGEEDEKSSGCKVISKDLFPEKDEAKPLSSKSEPVEESLPGSVLSQREENMQSVLGLPLLT